MPNTNFSSSTEALRNSAMSSSGSSSSSAGSSSAFDFVNADNVKYLIYNNDTDLLSLRGSDDNLKPEEMPLTAQMMAQSEMMANRVQNFLDLDDNTRVNIQLIPGRKQYYGLDKADSGKSLYYLMADQYK
ncbi:MAG: hypothetical protein LBG89_00685, partial [Rickettsiales bacterium]|nr:hypothetical protein [Rickettsiales bacterium]